MSKIFKLITICCMITFANLTMSISMVSATIVEKGCWNGDPNYPMVGGGTGIVQFADRSSAVLIGDRLSVNVISVRVRSWSNELVNVITGTETYTFQLLSDTVVLSFNKHVIVDINKDYRDVEAGYFEKNIYTAVYDSKMREKFAAMPRIVYRLHPEVQQKGNIITTDRCKFGNNIYSYAFGKGVTSIYIKKNDKEIFAQKLGLNEYVSDMRTFVLRGKVFFDIVISNTEYGVKSHRILLSEDASSGSIRNYLETDNFYPYREKRVIFDTIYLPGDLNSDSYWANWPSSDFCMLVKEYWSSSFEGYCYIFDYDKNNDKLVFVELGEANLNVDISNKVNELHKLINK